MTVPDTNKSVASSTSANPAPAFLTAKIRIGSIKGPISYGKDQQVFHHDDIPESRRQRKEDVKKWLKSKILSTDRQDWNKSSALNVNDGYGYPICERRQAENKVRDRANPYVYNFRAETLQYASVMPGIDQPGKFHISRTALGDVPGIAATLVADRVQRGYFKRTEEMPTHPDIIGKTAWNNGTQLTEKERTRGLTEMTESARASTARVNRRLNMSSDYYTPFGQQSEISKTVRDQKRVGAFVGGPSGTFNGHHVLPSASVPPQSPTASSAGGNRSMSPKSRPVTRGSAAHAHPQEASAFKNRYSVEPSRKYTSTTHTGVWELSKADGRMMWSDTGSFIFDSRGDKVISHNPDAFNFEGPTLAKPSKASTLVAKDHVDRR
jgi:hypothetical protein